MLRRIRAQQLKLIVSLRLLLAQRSWRSDKEKKDFCAARGDGGRRVSLVHEDSDSLVPRCLTLSFTFFTSCIRFFHIFLSGPESNYLRNNWIFFIDDKSFYFIGEKSWDFLKNFHSKFDWEIFRVFVPRETNVRLEIYSESLPITANCLCNQFVKCSAMPRLFFNYYTQDVFASTGRSS